MKSAINIFTKVFLFILVIIVGDSNVGKTKLFKTYINSYSDIIHPTIGVEY